MMARLLQLAILATLALLTFAAPAPASPRSLTKRSFQAKAAGRRQRSGLEDLEIVKNKYQKLWEIIIVGASGDTSSASAAATSSTSIPTSLYPIPYSTAANTIVVTPTFTPTPYGTAAPSSAPSSIPAGPPTYGNSTTTSTASAPAASSTAGSEDGTVAANPEDSAESAYLSPVTIGGQEFNLDFDTGSADLWVYGVDSVTSGRTAFNPSKSSSWKRLAGATWEIQYGDGSGAAGFVGTDVVDVGGSTVHKQAVEVAEQVSEQFNLDDDLDGLLGLSFSSINNVSPKTQLTFFDNVKADLTSPLFTADLEESTGKGTYTFGSIDHSKYTGNLHYTPVDNSNGFWQINTPGFLIGEQSKECSDCSMTIVDTGTSLLYLDFDTVDAYYKQTSFAHYNSTYGVYLYPCSQADNLPSLGISIGDWVAHINGSDLNYGHYPNEASSTCMGGVQPTPNQGLAILGDVFLKQFFVVFDGGNMQVGVANKD